MSEPLVAGHASEVVEGENRGENDGIVPLMVLMALDAVAVVVAQSFGVAVAGVTWPPGAATRGEELTWAGSAGYSSAVLLECICGLPDVLRGEKTGKCWAA